jgi:hypothetical protein
MSHLEELTLYLRIWRGSKFISGTDLDNEILTYMPQLHTFTFYIDCINQIVDSGIHLSATDIEQTFTNIKYKQVICMVDYSVDSDLVRYRIFSLPTKFHRLEDIKNNIPNIVFNSVTYLKVRDGNAFKHEFFIRLARAFPFLKSLSISNRRLPFWRFDEHHLREKEWCSIIEYPHLIFLDVENANPYYVENLLNETKTHLPNLKQLKVTFEVLKLVTENFTRDDLRRTCLRVERLIVHYPIDYPENVYRYFPLL